MSIKAAKTTKPAAKAKATAPQYLTENMLEIQQEVMQAFTFDADNALQGAKGLIEAEGFNIARGNIVQSVKDFKALPYKPAYIGIHLSNFTTNEAWMMACSEFITAGFEIETHKYLAATPCSVINKPQNQIVCYFKTPESLVSGEAEVTEMAKDIAAEQEQQARNEYFQRSNILALCNEKLEANKAHNLELQMAEFEAAFEANLAKTK